MIQDLSGSRCIKGTGESTLVMDSPVPLMHQTPVLSVKVQGIGIYNQYRMKVLSKSRN